MSAIRRTSCASFATRGEGAMRVLPSHRTSDNRGQTMVEFVLLLPILLMLLLGVADFGRVFHAGVVIESASRAAAEAAA